jgi:hypothetical protein
MKSGYSIYIAKAKVLSSRTASDGNSSNDVKTVAVRFSLFKNEIKF